MEWYRVKIECDNQSDLLVTGKVGTLDMSWRFQWDDVAQKELDELNLFNDVKCRNMVMFYLTRYGTYRNVDYKSYMEEQLRMYETWYYAKSEEADNVVKIAKETLFQEAYKNEALLFWQDLNRWWEGEISRTNMNTDYFSKVIPTIRAVNTRIDELKEILRWYLTVECDGEKRTGVVEQGGRLFVGDKKFEMCFSNGSGVFNKSNLNGSLMYIGVPA